ncbi:MAG: hypothetical protein N3B21_01900 [Clostridia bacterium]|nr:hypothetical protein [Clostridia bacterium]
MKKLIFTAQVLLVLFLIVGCSTGNGKASKEPSKQASKVSQTVQPTQSAQPTVCSISYNQFEIIFDRLKNEIKVDGYKYLSGSEGDNVTIIDPILTFGKRTNLTLDGKFDTSHPLTTQETLIFANKKNDRYFLIKMSYTKTDLDNDIINYSSEGGYKGTNEALIKKSDLAIFSYKNLIFTVLQVDEKAVDTRVTEAFMKEIIKIITK